MQNKLWKLMDKMGTSHSVYLVQKGNIGNYCGSNQCKWRNSQSQRMCNYLSVSRDWPPLSLTPPCHSLTIHHTKLYLYTLQMYFPNCKMYLSRALNVKIEYIHCWEVGCRFPTDMCVVFVQIAKCFCTKLQIVFVKIVKCICENFKIYLSVSSLTLHDIT